MFKRFLKALNDNAQMIHDYHCGIPFEDNKVIPFTLVCKFCKMEIELDTMTEHRCEVMHIEREDD